MPISSTQKSAIEEVISAILSATAPRGKRQLCTIFMELVDRDEWPEYYEIIPEPRCLDLIKSGVAKGRYKDATDVFTDLSLVFWNALYYNEPGSGIAMDAETLKTLLETEWKKRAVLPGFRTSPPPGAAQKVNKNIGENIAVKPDPEPSATKTAPAPIAVAVPTPTPARTATPSAQRLALPTTSTSTSNFSYAKPIPIRPRSAQRLASPDMEVDIISADSDDMAGAVSTERDPASEDIVKQLEKGLPRWPGFCEQGWMGEVGPDRLVEVVQAIKSHKDIIGNRLSTALESVPEESTIPNLSYTTPLSLKLIESRVRAKSYASSKEFDMEMARLFEKARRWHEPGTDAYGRVLLLQRLYQALTSANPLLGPQHHSQTNFASLHAGPGNTKPVHGSDAEGVSGVTTHRVLTKDRTFVDEVHYKGWSVKLADWLHLSNPDDPGRPIIGQVFRCWVSDEFSKKGQRGVTVSWYFRPEQAAAYEADCAAIQTYHPSNRKFWEGEVFKTSHFADHPLEDIIEKIACQFTARHIRGRPRPPFWYPGFPLYVCDSRYNDRDRMFVRIKNWNSCVPEEVRKSSEFMPIYPFERTVYPITLPSPFLMRGPKGVVKGPGGLLQPTDPVGVEDGVRKRARRSGVGDTGVSRGSHYLGESAQRSSAADSIQHQHPASGLPQQPRNQRPMGPDRSITAAVGGTAVLANAYAEKLPPETTRHFDRDPETNEVLWFAAPPLNVARAHPPKHSLTYLHFLAKKRKEQTEGTNTGSGHPSKRSRGYVPPTVTETMRSLVKALADD
ncbi:RSC complex protein [Crucibulum laeve]|uniref:RSC complex protein n=1 Tax=Crucibulum laeve TaxID=68775 RepID=A0A5C3M146_9AGAR|nr:RSC complex protein [Crucibulum laeve]